MPQPDVTAEDVVAALDEFDQLGREAFLAKHHFGEARSYFLVRDGKYYDSKAVVGAAHAIRHGEPVTAAEFSGGEATVKKLLDALGFTVQVRRNPAWTRDEIILACDLVHQNEWKWLDDADPRVVELSELLNRLPIHPAEIRTSTFRNANGVARKTVDIATQHPAYTGASTHGNRLDVEVLNEFLAEPDRMTAYAQALRFTDHTIAAADALPELDLEDDPAGEGGLLERRHLARERDTKLRRRKITAARQKHGHLACEVCYFDFEQTYGTRGVDFIECHHKIPLHVSGAVATKLADLALLCSNCHRMIHRGKPWLTIEELQAMIKQNRRSATASGCP